MTIDELVRQLRRLRDEYGDLEVTWWGSAPNSDWFEQRVLELETSLRLAEPGDYSRKLPLVLMFCAGSFTLQEVPPGASRPHS